MEYHEVISEMRQNKNLKVQDLLANKMSRSSYNRYVSGQTDIYSQHFFTLLEELHLTFAELDLITHSQQIFDQTDFFQKINQATVKKNHVELELLYQYAINSAKFTVNDFYTHVVSVLEFSLNKRKLNYTTFLKPYLLRAFTWTNYEIELFTLLLPYLSEMELSLFLNKIERILSNTHRSVPYNLKKFHLLCELIFYFIDHSDKNKILHYINLLETYPLDDEMAYEKLLFIFFSQFKLILLKRQHLSNLDSCITTAHFLGLTTLHKRFSKCSNKLYKLLSN